jgi:DNA-binding PadR family transcriptional regulator
MICIELKEVIKLKHTGKHTGAFLLLFLTEGDNYGGKLLQKCREELPNNPIDSPILYRTLKQLEKEGCIESYLDSTDTDKPIKMYRMTEIGRTKLEAFKTDIQEKMKNLTFFMQKYKDWKGQ